jgi:hypothetical protein
MIARWPWAGAAATLVLALVIRAGGAAVVEPSPVATAHPTLTPPSALQTPLRLAADQTLVWRADQEQRLLLSGGVTITLGYRTLKADAAAVWLTPSRESAVNTFDAAIYLSGNVELREGDAANASITSAKELLVTTRLSQNVQFTGTLKSQEGENSPVFQRGKALRDEVLTRRPAPLHTADMTITTVEEALQSGWIARGPNNRIIPGPGDIQVERDPQGNIRIVPATQAAKPPKPRPSLFAIGDPGSVPHTKIVGKEFVAIVPGVYLLYDSRDGKPPLEFRAQRMVAFGPVPESLLPATSTAPATRPSTTRATATASAPASRPSGAPAEAADIGPDFLRYVTGVYLEGDVTLDQGDQVMLRAERVYYDFTSNRAIMLDATLASVDTARQLPIYLRAGEIRQLARGEFAAKDVRFSTSEFYTPHYHIGASEAYLRDISPAATQPSGQSGPTAGLGPNGLAASKDWEFAVAGASINVQGMPIFWWPFLAGDTSQLDIPLRTIRVGNSRNYGMSLLMDWDLFGLAGVKAPQGMRADLTIDYFGKRGPAGGIQSEWNTPDDHGSIRSYALLDGGSDWLGWARGKVLPTQEERGWITARDRHDFGDGWTLQIEGAYVTDPTFAEAYFQREFDVGKEHDTSVFLDKRGSTDDFSFLVKYNLMDFTVTADRIDEQYTTNKLPELKYWRIGDSLLDLFTYYSETSIANVQMDITNFTPERLGHTPVPSDTDGPFLGAPANRVPALSTYRDYYRSLGWTTAAIVRGDTRQEIHLPLRLGDIKVTPFLAGRATWWNTDFADDTGDSTTRLWGGGGLRSSVQFWKVYNDVDSDFFDIHRLRHVIEPQFNIYAGASSVARNQLQPFDRDVEGITGASGTQLAINQKWQTKRGEPGHQRDVDWIVLNLSWNQFWNQDQTDTRNLFYPAPPARGFFFMSRPDLSLATSSINLDWTWRLGERVRFLGDLNYSLDTGSLEQLAAGIAVDQTENLSYFFGNRYIGQLKTDEWTFGLDYQITKKYELLVAESFDVRRGTNILTSVTLLRRLPRFIAAVTVTYDANNADTSILFTAWPQGLPDAGFGNRTGSRTDQPR